MTSLLLSPHNDDAVLFASFLCLHHWPHVVTVLRDANGRAEEREAEDREAVHLLGCGLSQWPFVAGQLDPGWDGIAEMMRRIDTVQQPPAVFAPWPERGGHLEHSKIGELAGEVFGGRVTYYTTYRYGGPRTTGTLVPYEREWVLRKLRALACYESQILHGPVRFFTMGLDEYTRP